MNTQKRWIFVSCNQYVGECVARKGRSAGMKECLRAIVVKKEEKDKMGMKRD